MDSPKVKAETSDRGMLYVSPNLLLNVMELVVMLVTCPERLSPLLKEMSAFGFSNVVWLELRVMLSAKRVSIFNSCSAAICFRVMVLSGLIDCIEPRITSPVVRVSLSSARLVERRHRNGKNNFTKNIVRIY